MVDNEPEEQPGLTASSTAQLSEAVKAAETQVNGSDDILENIEADAVLDNLADEAKSAEKFNHGKNDAGTKK